MASELAEQFRDKNHLSYEKRGEKEKFCSTNREASGQKQKAVPMGLIGDGLALKSGITPSTEIAAPYT
ncbi:hypothetical protein OUZ56_003539 [Daphnia magna]|uniref:Uncharacterized protein n=1 Tax=Daphnia magna TaxID=35525 RepID=A0ABR0A9D6_9CRUS|nr:hypothetical protein OUZ56_003539 [Daphnia magna]